MTKHKRVFLQLLSLHLFLIVAFNICSISPGFAQASSADERAKGYINLTRIAPFYGWPGVDLDHMKLSIDALEASRAEILSVSDQYNDGQKKLIETSLYPTKYLTQMVATEQLRRKLLQTQSNKALNAYHQQLVLTIKQHHTHLTNLEVSLTKIAKAVEFKGLAFHFGRSSFAHFLEGITAYRKEAEQNLKSAHNRWLCLKDELSDCEQATWNIIPLPNDVKVSSKAFDTPSARITRAIRQNGRLGGKAAGLGWAVLNRSDCYPNQTSIPFLTWQFPTASGLPIYRPEVVSDVYVHDHQIDEGSNNYERLLQRLGMEGFLFQSHTNLYACPDAAGDAARLRAMIFVYEHSKNLDWDFEIIDNPKLQKSVSELKVAAEQLKDATILAENYVQSLMHHASKFLAGFKRSELVSNLGNQRLELLETLALAYRLQTPFLSRDIMNLVYGNTAIADYVPYAPWGFLEELMFTRSGPELLLGGTNSSIIGSNYPQIERYRNGVSPRLRSYNEDLSKIYGEQQMIELLLKGLSAEYKLAGFQKRPYFLDQ